MYSNNEFNFGHDVEAKVFSVEKDKEVGSITIREVGQDEENANFVGGGIASGGQLYVVSTMDNIDYILPYKHKLIIDDQVFIITRKLGGKTNLEGKFSFKPSRKESILYLE